MEQAGKALLLELMDQKDRLFLWLPVVFGLGIALYFSLRVEPGIVAAVLPILITLPFLGIAWRRQHDSVVAQGTYFAVFALVMMCMGFAAAKISTEIYGTPILKKSIRITQVIGTIETIENLGGTNGSRVVLRDPVIEKIAPEDTPKKIRLRMKKDQGLEAGQSISALVKIDPTSPPVLPGAYDFQRHLFFHGIGAVGFAFKQPEILEHRDETPVSEFFESLRSTIYTAIEKKAGPATAGIMTALITGQRGAIAEEDDDAMRESGLYHLLSISGTHVSMVAAVLFFFSRLCMALSPWMALHWPIKKIAAVIAMSGAVFYCVLAGADVPAVRAVLMTGLVLLAIVLDRSPLSLRLIAFAALVVLIVSPYSLVGVSFQMSFAAVAALICFFDYIQPLWTRLYSRAGFIRKSALYLIGLVMTSVIAGGMTGLFGLYHFQQFAVYGVLANMIAVPLTGLIVMPAAILALILMPFGIEGFALEVMEWGTIWILAIAHWTAGLDGAVIHVQQWPVSTFVFLCGGIVFFLLWRGWYGKGIAAGFVCIGLLLTMFHKQPDIMVADGGELIAVRQHDELYFSSTRKNKFAAENWLRLSGKDGEKPKSFTDEAFQPLCDEHGCRIEAKENLVAFSYDQSAWREDCAWADLLISTVPVKKKMCPQDVKIFDLFDFKRNGAHAFYLDDGSVRMRSTGAERGMRPWTNVSDRYGTN